MTAMRREVKRGITRCRIRPSRTGGPLLVATLLLAGSSTAQQFLPGQILAGQTPNPTSICAADLDGDGDLDVLTLSEVDGKIMWHENTDERGSFGPQRPVAEQVTTGHAIIAADLDGDGDQDVALASRSAYYDLVWYENTDGRGTFGPAIPITTEAPGTLSIHAADLDGDDDVDLLSASKQDDEIAWYENLDGEGTFGPELVITDQADSAFSVLAADMDGDGDLDVLSTSLADDTIAWYENLDGQRTFGPRIAIATTALDPVSVSAADVDGDGDLDVMAASMGDATVAWYPNLDGQGDFFGPRRVIADGQWFVASVTATDLDGDGDCDALTAAGSTGVGIPWFENVDGLGAFQPRQEIAVDTLYVRPVSAWDLDGDGDRDVLAAIGTWDTTAWFENMDGEGTFGPMRVITTRADAAMAVRADDVDGDGDHDVLTASANDDTIAWYENLDGEGTYGPPRVVTNEADRAMTVHSADLDGDGDVDVLSASSGDHEVAWYENLDGEGAFGPPRLLSHGVHGTISVYTGDLDGDGDQDVLAAAHSDDVIAWKENVDGLGNFGPARVISLEERSPRAVRVSDLDGDGDLDVLSASSVEPMVSWYENVDGQGSFGPRRIITDLADGAVSVHAADLDGDGDEDVLSASTRDWKVAWYENLDGQGSFGPQRIITDVAYTSTCVHASDLDGDGDLDVLSASDRAEGIAWYENTDGQGSFGPLQVVSRETDYAWSVFAADLDGDGDEDVLSASADDDRIAWYRNEIHDASAAFRNAGVNPASYTTSLPVLGWDLIGTVDLAGTTGHDFAWLAGFAAPLTMTLPGGQVLLVDASHAWGEIFGLAVASGPVATFTFPIPDLAALVGLELSAQALHFGGGSPFALSNARDFVLGR